MHVAYANDVIEGNTWGSESHHTGVASGVLETEEVSLGTGAPDASKTDPQ